MGSKVDLGQKVFEDLAGRRQTSHELRERGQQYDDREKHQRAEEEFKRVEYGSQSSAEGQQQSWQRKPLLDQKRAYYKDQGTPHQRFKTKSQEATSDLQ